MPFHATNIDAHSGYRGHGHLGWRGPSVLGHLRKHRGKHGWHRSPVHRCVLRALAGPHRWRAPLAGSLGRLTRNRKGTARTRMAFGSMESPLWRDAKRPETRRHVRGERSVSDAMRSQCSVAASHLHRSAQGILSHSSPPSARATMPRPTRAATSPLNTRSRSRDRAYSGVPEHGPATEGHPPA